jgi:hypothetical protein
MAGTSNFLDFSCRLSNLASFCLLKCKYFSCIFSSQKRISLSFPLSALFGLSVTGELPGPDLIVGVVFRQ